MKKSASTINNLLSLIGGLILAYLVYRMGIDQIWQNVLKTGPWFWAVILVWGIVYVLNAYALRCIIRDGSQETEKVSFLKCFVVTVSGYAIASSNPTGLAGSETSRIFQLKSHIGGEKATSAVILYNMMHFISHFLIWIFTIPLILLTVKLSSTLQMSLGIGFIFLLFLITLFFYGYKKGMVMRICNILSKLPFIGKYIKRITAKNHVSITAIDEQVSSLYLFRRSNFYKSLLFEIAGRLISCFEIYFILLTVGVELSLLDSVIIYSLSTLIANIMFFSPMQLATRELGYIVATKSIGIIVPGVGLFVSLMTRIREFFWIGIGLILLKIKSK